MDIQLEEPDYSKTVYEYIDDEIAEKKIEEYFDDNFVTKYF